MLELTNSPLMLGFVGAAHSILFLLLALVGGNTADRIERRKLLFFTQSTMMALAFILGLLSATGKVKVWHVALIAVGMGMANSFDMPTRQAFVYEIVGKENILSAVSLNSMLFNLAQIAGPTLVGIIVASIGISWCFFLNSISFLAFIVALKMIVITPLPRRRMAGSTLKNILEGLSYVSESSVLKSLIIIASLSTIFAIPFGILMPIFARDILKVGSRGFGVLMSSTGIGALIGGLTVASLGNIERKNRLFFAGAMTLYCTILLFSISKLFYLSCFFPCNLRISYAYSILNFKHNCSDIHS